MSLSDAHSELVKAKEALEKALTEIRGALSAGSDRVEPKLPLHKRFTIYRQYIKHEHDLINNRLSWNFTIQGFLFAAYTLTFQKIADIRIALAQNYIVPDRVEKLRIPHTLYDLHLLLLAISAVGLGVSFFVYISVQAARMASVSLQKMWNETTKDWSESSPPTSIGDVYRALFKPPDPQPTNPLGLPNLFGGGHPLADLLGFYAPSALPIILMVVWLVLLVEASLDLSGS